MSGALKLILEMGGEGESEDSVECPKCGCMCESEDKYCCECGAKLPAPEKVKAGARMKAMQGMMEGPEED